MIIISINATITIAVARIIIIIIIITMDLHIFHRCSQKYNFSLGMADRLACEIHLTSRVMYELIEAQPSAFTNSESQIRSTRSLRG
jgi:hypothetical protein